MDANAQQCDCAMGDVMTVEPAAARLEAFGALVREVDGHDVEALAAAASPWPAGRPLVVLCRTDPCRGMDLLRDRAPRLHYVRFGDDGERARYEAHLEAMIRGEV